MKNIIMVVHHKSCKMYTDALYRPFLVGAGSSDTKELNDAVGDNISFKNPTFCELTALYWIWKNDIKSYDNIGLCHYRRYFVKSKRCKSRVHYPLEKDIQKYLKEHDLVLPSPFHLDRTVEKYYYEVGCGKLKDLKLTRQAIKELYPQYCDAFDFVLKQNHASYCNMFIMPSALLNEYCQWLFDILFYVEDKIDLSDYTTQEKRVFGYLSEILLNVWVRANRYDVKYLNMVFTPQTFFNRLKSKLKRIFGF